MGLVRTRDGAEIFYKDWGDGPPVVLRHGWPLNAGSWEAQMLFPAERGLRCVAHDRRELARFDVPTLFIHAVDARGADHAAA